MAECPQTLITPGNFYDVLNIVTFLHDLAFTQYVLPVLMDVLSSLSSISSYLFPSKAVAHALSQKHPY